jgi:ankyrin repeat protein
MALRQGQREIVKRLLANGADVNAENKWNRTPLDTAVDRGHKEIVDMLREHTSEDQSSNVSN